MKTVEEQIQPIYLTKKYLKKLNFSNYVYEKKFNVTFNEKILH